MVIVFTRTLIIFIALLVSTRIMGKRQMGELELNEFITAVLMANLASHPLQDIGIPLMNGLIPIVTLFCCELVISGLTMKSITLRSLLHGKPSFIVTNGVINQKEMKKNRLTIEELAEALRAKSITDIKTVQYAILETDGKINTVLFPAEQTVTVKQMGINPEDNGFPSVIINDGKIMEKNLNVLGKDKEWLKEELKKRLAKGPEDVYIMMLDNAGKIYYLPREDVK